METTSLDNLFEKHKKPFYVTDRTKIFRIFSKSLICSNMLSKCSNCENCSSKKLQNIYLTHEMKMLKDGSLKTILGGWVILQEEASKDKWLYVDPLFLRFNV